MRACKTAFYVDLRAQMPSIEKMHGGEEKENVHRLSAASIICYMAGRAETRARVCGETRAPAREEVECAVTRGKTGASLPKLSAMRKTDHYIIERVLFYESEHKATFMRATKRVATMPCYMKLVVTMNMLSKHRA